MPSAANFTQYLIKNLGDLRIYAYLCERTFSLFHFFSYDRKVFKN